MMKSKTLVPPISPELYSEYQVEPVSERMIPTRNGETHLYVFYPESADKEALPLVINLHGGAFIKGFGIMDLKFCADMCSKMKCVVVDVDYKTAPEKRYPYATEECYDAVKYCYENPEEFRVDKSRIAICGHSAGGNLAAAVCLMNTEREEFQIKFQFLDYPATDLYTEAALKKHAYVYPRLNPINCAGFMSVYIDREDTLLPTASPVFAPSYMLEKLPPTMMFTCELDPLRDEGMEYARKLHEAGVPVTAKHFKRSEHGFLVLKTGEEHALAGKMLFEALELAFRR